VFVDNFWFFGPRTQVMRLHEELRPLLKLIPEKVTKNTTQEIYDLLGIKIIRNLKTNDFTLSQDDYATKILERFGGELGRHASTPLLQAPNPSTPEDVELLKHTQE
ncbi:unnamed protein product, partial [Amoebophrya sp. A25]